MTNTEQFQADLKALLARYDVTMSIEEDTSGYYSVPRINFFSYSKYDDNGRVVANSINFDCNYLDGK